MINNFFSLIFSLCYLLQLIIDSSIDNVITSTICFVSSVFGLFFISKVCKGPTLSSIALVGFQASYFWLPLVALTFDWTPITHNLALPVDSFTAAAIGLFSLMPAYLFSIDIAKDKSFISYSHRLNTLIKNNIRLTKQSFFTIITFALIVRLFTTGLRIFGRLDFVTKLIEPVTIFGALSFSCLFITPATPFLRKYKVQSYPFCVFVLTILFTLPSLSRFNILIIVANTLILLAASLFYPQSNNQARTKSSKILINIVLAALLIFPVLDRIADATAYVRFSGLAFGGPLQTAQRIADAAINGDRHIWTSTYTGPYPWDDSYTRSTIFKRFISVNYLDLSYRFHRLQDNDARSLVRTYEYNRIIALAPDPIINLFTPNFDKESVIRSSFGDYNYYVVSGIGLGGFRTGNLLVSLMALFGYFWPLAFFLMSTIVFIMFNLISLPFTSQAYRLLSRFSVGPITICLLYESLTVFTSAAGGSESLSRIVGLFLRVIPIMSIYFAFLARSSPLPPAHHSTTNSSTISATIL
jgi:hypothetical protein